MLHHGGHWTRTYVTEFTEPIFGLAVTSVCIRDLGGRAFPPDFALTSGAGGGSMRTARWKDLEHDDQRA